MIIQVWCNLFQMQNNKKTSLNNEDFIALINTQWVSRTYNHRKLNVDRETNKNTYIVIKSE